MREFPESNAEWERRISWFKNTNQHSELDGIDGEPVEILYEIQRLWIPWRAHLMISKDELSSCRCFNDIEWGHEDNKKFFFVRQKVRFRSLVIPRAWFRNEMVQFSQREV